MIENRQIIWLDNRPIAQHRWAQGHTHGQGPNTNAEQNKKNDKSQGNPNPGRKDAEHSQRNEHQAPIAQTKQPAQTIEQTLYIHADHLNTPRMATDETGAIVWQWHSDAFGVGTANNDVDGDGIAAPLALRFPGQYFDSETGLHYNYFRDYDPSIGRYLQSDPIGLEGGINTYAYVEGNPLSRSDPLGLVWTPGQVGMTYGDEWDDLNIPESDDPCGCFAEAFLGYAEGALAATEAATGPYIDKPRGGIAGGGPSGRKTSAVSSVAHQINKKYGKSAATAALRGAGRFASRFVPYAGTALLIYDISVYNECMKDCEEDECNL